MIEIYQCSKNNCDSSRNSIGFIHLELIKISLFNNLFYTFHKEIIHIRMILVNHSTESYTLENQNFNKIS